MIYSVISWIVFGLIVGAIARLLVPGKQSMNWIATIVLGVIGSFVGGGISWLIFGSPDGAVNPAGWIMSIIGAVVLVLIYGRVMSSQATSS
ncbi:GlsB/YeaQ/YmgE family stress response membrane protein [Anatilimnocola sp. NA78]|uniref:GlsB/YeaQ/YmgE family stress response membrane protein n=1 Tax=Anatilimnocola sp. NA78 TaxID=3415683 RepID=UPI003CE5A31F